MKTECEFGLRREAKRHAAFTRTTRADRSTCLTRPKAVSPLRSATALQNLAVVLLCVLMLIPPAARAATNDLTALLQQGLFEEQANRNLDAAISNYQTLAAQFDKDRQLAATAVFRLGECYRALGKTNEAAVQYQRILRDFPDQQTLATLSRQNLAGMGAASSVASTPESAALHPVNPEEDREILRLQQMIQNSPDLINALSDGNTPLGNAAAHGWLKVASFLLDHGADVHAAYDKALVSATEAGNRAMVELLLSRGANVNALGNTPLHIAASKGFQAVTEVLLEHKAEVNAQRADGMQPLMSAASANHAEIAKLLLAAAANPNIRDGKGRTALNYALGTSPEMIQMLLKAGANPNTEDSDGRTPLSYAVERDSPAVVKMLLAAKADPNGGKLDAPLMAAIGKKDVAVADILLQSGANPNTKSAVTRDVYYNNGMHWAAGHPAVSPLFLAVAMNQLPVVQLLLKFKADPNDAQTDGRAVIFSALSHPDILKALLEAGAKADLQDQTDNTTSLPAGPGSFQGRLQILMNPDLKRTPLLYAAGGESNVVAVAELLQHGANPNATDGRGNTALHYAAMWLADEKVFALLLDAKANPNVRNKIGETPLDLVKQRLRMQLSGSRFPNRNQLNVNTGEVSSEQKDQAEKLISLLHQHGALDNLPDWDRITVSRPAVNFSGTVFQRYTNDWNHFTLLELVYRMYPNETSSMFSDDAMSFPDLARVVVVRPSTNGAAAKRIEVNLLNATNGVDCSRDLPLEFGDVVEIPEREHSLAEGKSYLARNQEMDILNYLRSRAGEVKLVVADHLPVSVPLQPGFESIRQVLKGSTSLAKLTSSSDLSRVKVTRRDPKTGKTEEWMVDCTKPGEYTSELWLRAGDVIEVPSKP